ncbi:MAG: carboxypeptidase regulatory-like domain-containing protein [Thermoanaerobaculia bacterium]
MVLIRRFRWPAVLCLVLALAASRSRAAEPAPGEVTLPLKEYLELVDKAESVKRLREAREKSRQAPFAEVVSQRLRVVLDGGDMADVESEYEVLVQGPPQGPVVLPVSGVPRDAEVRTAEGRTAAAVGAGKKAGEWLLVAPEPGRYSVRISGPAPLADGSGRLVLAPVAAPVSMTEVQLPADLAWSAPGTVVVEDRVEGTRRIVRLTAKRGRSQTIEVRRKVDGGEAEKLLAQCVVLTLVQLRPDGPRRHDVVLYDVVRGGLGSFTVDLPEGLNVESVGTDEGDVIPAVESRRLTVQRRKQLRGAGYLVLTSTPTAGPELNVEPVKPEVGVRARYLALSSAVAADARPLPADSWARVDLDDLPANLREALGGLDLAAAWRLTGVTTGVRMAVSLLPAAPSLPALVSLRETTTLMTVDGTLLHRDRFVLRPGALGTALDLTLPPGATLWSAKVDDVPVRPLVRGGGTISVPLGFDAGKDSVVEVVAVLEKAVPTGRSELALTLPRMAVPVQEHRWRLLLPDTAQYRFRSGDLRPAQENVRILASNVPPSAEPWATLQNAPGVLTDRINVGGNESGQQSSYVGPGSGTAMILGTVTDEKGGALPGVTLTLTGGGSVVLAQLTDARGRFRFVTLPGGQYSLKAELEGFSSVEYPLSLTNGQSLAAEFKLSTAVEDVITVTAESPVLDERRAGNTQTYTLNDEGSGVPRRPRKREDDRGEDSGRLYKQQAQSLQQGLVGGVKPLPIAIPESGKLLLLTGVLPPAEVGVALEVKAKRR